MFSSFKMDAKALNFENIARKTLGNFLIVFRKIENILGILRVCFFYFFHSEKMYANEDRSRWVRAQFFA